MITHKCSLVATELVASVPTLGFRVFEFRVYPGLLTDLNNV